MRSRPPDERVAGLEVAELGVAHQDGDDPLSSLGIACSISRSVSLRYTLSFSVRLCARDSWRDDAAEAHRRSRDNTSTKEGNGSSAGGQQRTMRRKG
jgi:hypothetical protein